MAPPSRRSSRSGRRRMHCRQQETERRRRAWRSRGTGRPRSVVCPAPSFSIGWIMSDVEVIVLDIDGGAMLRDCIDSIKKQSIAPREVIVFDNGSRMPLQLAGVRIIRSETNVGFAAGVNAAYRQTTADYVALVNNDVILDRDWLATVKKALDRDVRIGAAQTVIRRDEQMVDGAGIDISDGTFRQIGHGLPLGVPLPNAWGVSATAALY